MTRYWTSTLNALAREERRNLVRAAGSHRRWAMTGSDLLWYLDTAIGFSVRCPRSFLAAMKRRHTELNASDSNEEECQF